MSNDIVKMILLSNLVMPSGKSHSSYSAMQTGWYGEGGKVKALIIADCFPMRDCAYADPWFCTLFILLMHKYRDGFFALRVNGKAQQPFETSVSFELIVVLKAVEKMHPLYRATRNFLPI